MQELGEPAPHLAGAADHERALARTGAMGGHEALQRIRALDPAVVAIASSGYSNDAVMSDFRRHGFAGAIAKPYTRAELQAALDEVLAARA